MNLLQSDINLLRRAVAVDDLDVAIKPIQDALGITDGDVAGNYFSGGTWEGSTRAGRAMLLAGWITLEIGMVLDAETAEKFADARDQVLDEEWIRW